MDDHDENGEKNEKSQNMFIHGVKNEMSPFFHDFCNVSTIFKPWIAGWLISHVGMFLLHHQSGIKVAHAIAIKGRAVAKENSWSNYPVNVTVPT